MDRLKASTLWWRGVCMTLAALALVIKIAVPAGFMVTDKAAGGFPLVLCTAQGAVVLDAGHHAPADPQAPQSHEAPCAFAGHGAAFAPPVLVAEAVAYAVSYEAVARDIPSSVAPGRGLVAPPPPSRGPPLTA